MALSQQEIIAFLIKKQEVEEKKFTDYINKKKTYLPGIKNNFTPLEDSCDSSLYSGTSYFICEIKDRPNSPSRFLCNGFFLQKNKLEGLIKKQAEIEKAHKIKPRLLYFNFCQDNVTLIFELTPDLNAYTWETRMLPKSQHDRKIVPKEITHLYDPIEIIK